MKSSGINLVMTVIGFAVSTLFIVFVCTRLICARIQLRASRRSIQRSYGPDPSTMERGLHGLGTPVLANFPAKSYIDSYFDSAKDVQCSICLSEYRKEDVLRILPHCGHYFHISCVDLWLLQNSTCPVCRISLRENIDNKCSMQPLFSSRTRASALDSASIHTYNCLLSARGFTSRSLEENAERSSNVADPENPSNSREHGCSAEDRDTVYPPEGNHCTKDSANKLVESPSSA